jgi:hypothetical protein
MSRIPQIAVDPDNDLGHSAVSDSQSYSSLIHKILSSSRPLGCMPAVSLFLQVKKDMIFLVLKLPRMSQFQTPTLSPT